MKLFTRITLSLLIGFATLSSASATIVTIMVGDNFYVTQNGTHATTMNTGDTLLFRYNGFSSHPTMSDSSPAAWTLFQMNSSNRTKMFLPNTFQPGTYPFHCTVHAFLQNGVWMGHVGTLTVLRPTANENARPTAVLNLYPNPSKGIVTLQFTAKAGTDYKLRLSNVIGQEVRTVALKPELSEAGTVIDLRDMPAGMYFYSLLVDGKAVSSKRLVLQD